MFPVASFDLPMTDAEVLNEIITQWEAIDDPDKDPVTFPEAIAEFLAGNRLLIADPTTDPELRKSLENEVSIIEGWFDEFSEMKEKKDAE